MADIQKQYEFGMKLYGSITRSLELINEMERSRAYLLKNKDPKSSKIVQILEEKIYQLESKLFDLHQTGARQDIFRNPAKILERLLAIAKEGQTASADFPPTDQQQEVYALLNQRLSDVDGAFTQLKQSTEWKKLNPLSQ